jgi:hypothetical protein
MALRNAKIILLNRANKQNKELLDFIKRNIQDLIRRARLKFSFYCIDQDEVQGYSRKGVRNFPAMQIEGRTFEKSSLIIQELIAFTKTTRQPAVAKSDEEEIDDYLRKEITDGVTKDSSGKFIQPKEDEDEASKINSEIRSKMIEEEQRRGIHRAQQQDPTYEPPHRAEPREEYRPPMQPRRDNIDPGDAVETLARMHPKSAEEQKDNELLRMLYERVGQ